MKIFHTCKSAAALAILAGGFRDMSFEAIARVTGVLVADGPLDINDGVEGTTVVSVNLPDDVFANVEKAAASQGTTPVAFVADAAARALPPYTAEAPDSPKKTLRQRFAGLIGGFHSGSAEPLSENSGEKFTDYLEQKRREGRL